MKLFWKENELLHALKGNVLTNTKETRSWRSFLDELGIPLHTADFKAALYKKWVKDLKFSLNELKGVHTRKLFAAIHYIKSKKDAILMLKKAKEQGQSVDEYKMWLKRRFTRNKTRSTK